MNQLMSVCVEIGSIQIPKQTIGYHTAIQPNCCLKNANTEKCMPFEDFDMFIYCALYDAEIV